jgi:hypothetical protein
VSREAERVTIRRILGGKSAEPKGSVEEELKEFMDRVKAEKIERARWTELEDWLKEKELSIAEKERRLAELRGYGYGSGPASSPSSSPKFTKEELEVVKLLAEMDDETRAKALQILTILRSGSMSAVPLLFSGAGGPSVTKLSDFAEAVGKTVASIKEVLPQPQPQQQQQQSDIRDKLLETLLLKYVDMMEKRAQTQEDTRSRALDEALSKVISYSIEQALSPKGSDLDYLADRLDKLRSVVAPLVPQTTGSADTTKVWLELRKMDQEYEKWKTELEMRRQDEERKYQMLGEIVKNLDVGRIVREGLGRMASASRGSSLPTIVCDREAGGCGSTIPVPPGVSEVVCASCGKAWRIGAGAGAGASAGSGAAEGAGAGAAEAEGAAGKAA